MQATRPGGAIARAALTPSVVREAASVMREAVRA